MAAPRITLYSTRQCAYCGQARAWFKAHGVKFQEFDVERSAKGRADFRRMGARGVPVIVVGGKQLNGFFPDRLKKLLKR